MNPDHPDRPGQDGPDRLLTDVQVGEILGVDPATVRSYAARGQMPPGHKIGGKRRWTLSEIEHHRDHPPRDNPRRLGRPPGSKDTRPRQGSHAIRRAEEIAARLANGETPTTAQIMTDYQVTERTAQRLLARARTMG